MIDRWNLIFLGLLLASIFFVGCTSSKSAENISNPGNVMSPSRSDVSESAATNTQASTQFISENNNSSNEWGSDAFTQNTTVFDQLDNRTSFELSLGDTTIQQDETSNTNFSYKIKINVTVKNSGTVPISVTFLTSALEDNSGDGCQSDPRFWCGAIDLNQINPGESKTQISNVTISSTKGYDDLSSQKFLLEGIINADSATIGHMNNHKSWLIDLKKSV
jgi:hypothetical protein